MTPHQQNKETAYIACPNVISDLPEAYSGRFILTYVCNLVGGRQVSISDLHYHCFVVGQHSSNIMLTDDKDHTHLCAISRSTETDTLMTVV